MQVGRLESDRGTEGTLVCQSFHHLDLRFRSGEPEPPERIMGKTPRVEFSTFTTKY